MTKTIALAGKGGTGKTTVASMLIHSLSQRVQGPILAIDADPAMNLHLALGLPEPATVGEIREEMGEAAQARQLGVAISRHDYLKHEVQMALEEGDRVDLLAMGRPEGQGCYCAANHLLRTVVDDLGKAYEYLVVDNEAGMEHISRRTTRDVDVLLVVTDPTIRGLKAAEVILRLADDIEVNVHRKLLVLNRVIGETPASLSEAISQMGVELAPIVPADARINELDALGMPLIQLNGDSPAFKAVEQITADIIESFASQIA
jgi:CO dehydrogenase maturation factor